MPELTFSFDAPLEANRVSSEDTQAQLDEFRQMVEILKLHNQGGDGLVCLP
jgi:hypothetical protein